MVCFSSWQISRGLSGVVTSSAPDTPARNCLGARNLLSSDIILLKPNLQSHDRNKEEAFRTTALFHPIWFRLLSAQSSLLIPSLKSSRYFATMADCKKPMCVCVSASREICEQTATTLVFAAFLSPSCLPSSFVPTILSSVLMYVFLVITCKLDSSFSEEGRKGHCSESSASYTEHGAVREGEGGLNFALGKERRQM